MIRQPKHMLVVVGLLALTVAGCGASAAAPKSYKHYSAKDGAFACDYPEGWEANGGGQSLMYWARFESGSAKIKVEADSSGSMMATASRPNGDAPGAEPIVASLHEMRKRQVAEEYGSNYKENTAKKVESKLGEGRMAEFLADASLGGSIHGYRATFLAHDHRLTVLCECPQSDWKTLKPAFLHVIQSMGQH